MRGYKSNFLDTNIFLRVLAEDNAGQTAECKELFAKAREGKIKITTSVLVLAEMVWTGMKLYKIPKEKMVEILNGIYKTKNLKISDGFNIELAISFFKNNNIKFIDAMIASNDLIRKNKAVIVSYDKDFDKIGIERVEPKELIKNTNMRE